jgi:hypothetical protein
VAFAFSMVGGSEDDMRLGTDSEHRPVTGRSPTPSVLALFAVQGGVGEWERPWEATLPASAVLRCERSSEPPVEVDGQVIVEHPGRTWRRRRAPGGANASVACSPSACSPPG